MWKKGNFFAEQNASAEACTISLCVMMAENLFRYFSKNSSEKESFARPRSLNARGAMSVVVQVTMEGTPEP